MLCVWNSSTVYRCKESMFSNLFKPHLQRLRLYTKQTSHWNNKARIIAITTKRTRQINDAIPNELPRLIVQPIPLRLGTQTRSSYTSLSTLLSYINIYITDTTPPVRFITISKTFLDSTLGNWTRKHNYRSNYQYSKNNDLRPEYQFVVTGNRMIGINVTLFMNKEKTYTNVVFPDRLKYWKHEESYHRTHYSCHSYSPKLEINRNANIDFNMLNRLFFL